MGPAIIFVEQPRGGSMDSLPWAMLPEGFPWTLEESLLSSLQPSLRMVTTDSEDERLNIQE